MRSSAILPLLALAVAGMPIQPRAKPSVENKVANPINIVTSRSAYGKVIVGRDDGAKNIVSYRPLPRVVDTCNNSGTR
ncbi:hypothetical protein EJ04DRAFT_160407 [Polyplosphaeria fusca]|uniref:Uncharacterized protein n=1 Tax=Polyplosphaeria fusca TaxID=682080 RepID=A0A9P4QKW8_9PLEO|nr:hypothetical protein EJ04DRAFT_160407 [Polyplosphaeria fusca]